MGDGKDHSIKLVQMYREAAHRYFTTRTNVTYLNAAAAGAITVALGHELLAVPAGCISYFLTSHSVIYFLGCLLIFLFALAATSIVNTLSNSIYRYLAMAIDIEVREFGVNYDPVSHTAFGVTTEFVPDIIGELTVKFSGNLWNIVNAAVMCYAAVLMAEVGFTILDKLVGDLIFFLGGLSYFSIVGCLVDLSILPSEKLNISIGQRMLKQWRSLFFIVGFVLLFAVQWAYGSSVLSDSVCYSPDGSIQTL